MSYEITRQYRLGLLTQHGSHGQAVGRRIRA